jgi:hypothetical protein
LSTFIINHDFVNDYQPGAFFAWGCFRDFCWPALPRACARSAQQSANPDRSAHQPCQPAAHDRGMGKIITVQFRRSRLPRRLLRDGWWLEPSPRRRVIAFPKHETLRPGAASTRKVRHLTLITNPGK